MTDKEKDNSEKIIEYLNKSIEYANIYSKLEPEESIKDERIYNIYADNIENLSGNIFFKIEGVKKVDIQKNCICITTLNTIENLDKIILF